MPTSQDTEYHGTLYGRRDADISGSGKGLPSAKYKALEKYAVLEAADRCDSRCNIAIGPCHVSSEVPRLIIPFSPGKEIEGFSHHIRQAQWHDITCKNANLSHKSVFPGCSRWQRLEPR